ncbi:uncharacterized protein LOC134217540 [Armigeres subalbatus]|uniref:uncharacterized protein LOC134217540 n=1 Tax=Armigeres subalbatus TaxID=124917 RepID=UPI002ED03545
MKIILTLLVVVVCAEATFKLGALLSLLRLKSNLLQPGYATYYRHAPVPIAIQPGYAVNYRQAPAAVSFQPTYTSFCEHGASAHPVHTSYYRHAPAQVPLYRSVQTAAPSLAPVSYYQFPQENPVATNLDAAQELGSDINIGNSKSVSFATDSHPEPAAVPIQSTLQNDFTAVPLQSYDYNSANTPSEISLSLVAPEATIPEQRNDFNVVPYQSVSYNTEKTRRLAPAEPVSFSAINAELASIPVASTAQNNYAAQSISFNPENAPPKSVLFNVGKAASVQQPLQSVVPYQSFSVVSGGTDYTVEVVRSEGRSYSLPEEHITFEQTVAPIAEINTIAKDDGPFKVNLHTPDIVSIAVDPSPNQIVNHLPIVLQPPALSQPVVFNSAVDTNAVSTAQAVADVSVANVPQPITASAKFDQAHLTQQIPPAVIPNIIAQVSPRIAQQTLPQVVQKVGSTVSQKQSEPVHIVTPYTQHKQAQNEKVVVMYATSLPRGQYDESENLVVPIGNQKSKSGAVKAKSESKIVFEKGLQVGHNVQEERRSVGKVNQQIISNFQRENAALKRQRQSGSPRAASAASTRGSVSYKTANAKTRNVQPQPR